MVTPNSYLALRDAKEMVLSTVFRTDIETAVKADETKPLETKEKRRSTGRYPIQPIVL